MDRELIAGIRKVTDTIRLRRMDGGSGSGNWGHEGGSGRGGSAKGGGVANRILADDGTYTSVAKKRMEMKRLAKLGAPITQEELDLFAAVVALMRKRYGYGATEIPLEEPDHKPDSAQVSSIG